MNRIRPPSPAAPRFRLFTRDISTDISLNGMFRTMTAAHTTIAAVRKLVGHVEKGLGLQFDGLRQ